MEFLKPPQAPSYRHSSETVGDSCPVERLSIPTGYQAGIGKSEWPAGEGKAWPLGKGGRARAEVPGE